MNLDQLQSLLDQYGPWGWAFAAAIMLLAAIRGRVNPSPATSRRVEFVPRSGGEVNDEQTPTVAGDTLIAALNRMTNTVETHRLAFRDGYARMVGVHVDESR